MVKEKFEWWSSATNKKTSACCTPDIAKILNWEIKIEFEPVDYSTPEKIQELDIIIEQQKDIMSKKDLKSKINRRAHDFTQK
jgi:hypothetical protein